MPQYSFASSDILCLRLMWLLLWFVVETVVPWRCFEGKGSNIQLFSLFVFADPLRPSVLQDVLASLVLFGICLWGPRTCRRSDSFLFPIYWRQSVNPVPTQVGTEYAAVRSRTLRRRGLSALWHGRLQNVPRLVADPRSKITTLHSQNLLRLASSWHAATCVRAYSKNAHAALQIGTCVFLPLQLSWGSTQVLFPLENSLSVYYITKRPLPPVASLPNLNGTLALLQDTAQPAPSFSKCFLLVPKQRHWNIYKRLQKIVVVGIGIVVKEKGDAQSSSISSKTQSELNKNI